MKKYSLLLMLLLGLAHESKLRTMEFESHSQAHHLEKNESVLLLLTLVLELAQEPKFGPIDIEKFESVLKISSNPIKLVNDIKSECLAEASKKSFAAKCLIGLGAGCCFLPYLISKYKISTKTKIIAGLSGAALGIYGMKLYIDSRIIIDWATTMYVSLLPKALEIVQLRKINKLLYG